MYPLEKVRKLNLFVTPETRNSMDIELIHDQILSTRIYIVLLTTIVIVIALFTVLRPIPIAETVAKPSLDTYLKLENTHASSLSCLCRQPTVSYASFFSIEPVFHQVSSVE